MFDGKNIVIYGASFIQGSLCHYIVQKLEQINEQILYFVDNNRDKQYTLWENKYEIYPVEKIKDDNKNIYVIIVTVKEYKEIEEQLNSYGLYRNISYEFIKSIEYLFDKNEYAYYRFGLRTIEVVKYWKPTQIRIELSSYCNIQCVYCRYHSNLFGDYKVQGCDKNMNWVTVKNIVNQINDIDSIDKILNVQKGEMFCNPDWFEMLQFIASNTRIKKFHFSTNGMLLTEDNITKLLSTNFDDISITVSIDGQTAVENDLYRSGSKFEVINQNLKHLKILANHKLTVNIQNLYIKDSTEASVNFNDENMVPDYLNRDKVFYDNIVTLPILEQNIETYNEILCDKFNLKKVVYNNQNADACPLPLTEIAIDAEGYVCVCGCDPRGNLMRIGNVNENHMLEIWNTGIMFEIRECYRKQNEIELCKGCVQYASKENCTYVFQKNDK